MNAIKEYLGSLFDQEFIPTGLKTGLIVGSLLVLINHGAALFRGEINPERWSGFFNYLMLYLVSVYGQYAYRRKISRSQQRHFTGVREDEK